MAGRRSTRKSNRRISKIVFLSDHDSDSTSSVTNMYDIRRSTRKSHKNDRKISLNSPRLRASARRASARRASERSRQRSSRKNSRQMVERTSIYENQQKEGVMKAFAVGSWLQNDVRLPQYIDSFIKNGYDDLSTIEHTLKERDLLHIGIKTRGHRKKIMMHAERLKTKHDLRWSSQDVFTKRHPKYVDYEKNAFPSRYQELKMPNRYVRSYKLYC